MYVGVKPDGKFVPGQLGMGLVEGIYIFNKTLGKKYYKILLRTP